MNKDRPLINFQWMQGPLDVIAVPDGVYTQPWFITDLNQWLHGRSVYKHREHIDSLLRLLQLKGTQSILDFTKGLSLNDTLWINHNDRYNWSQVSLYRNDFDSVIEKTAFDGGMYGQHFSQTSPELGTNGMLAKCWHRESNGNIYLYKQGTSKKLAFNAGNEPYSEYYCSQLLDVLGFSHVHYNLIKYRKELVSRCPLFTSEQVMFLPLHAVVAKPTITSLYDFCESHDFLRQLAEILIFDAIVLNTDRHSSNIGVLCNANDYSIQSLGPIFDNGLGLLPYWVQDSDGDILEYAKSRNPSLYSEFIGPARTMLQLYPNIYMKLQSILPFKFDIKGSYNLSMSRIHQLEKVINHQISSILSIKDELPTNQFD